MQTKQSDEQVIERARRVVLSKRKLRWVMLIYAAVFLWMCGYATVKCIHKIENLNELSMGFAYGMALAFAWMTFGILGGLCLGKFLTGLQGDYRMQELLVSYHDRLKALGQLPETANQH